MPVKGIFMKKENLYNPQTLGIFAILNQKRALK